jgi:hypothetical protein
LNVIERLWKPWRRRATHNRLFETLADRKGSLRNSLRYFPTVTHRVAGLLEGCYPPVEEQTPSTGL